MKKAFLILSAIALIGCANRGADDESWLAQDEIMKRLALPNSLLASDVNIYFDYGDTTFNSYKICQEDKTLCSEGSGVLLFLNEKSGNTFTYTTDKYLTLETLELITCPLDSARNFPKHVFHYKYNDLPKEGWENSPLLYNAPFQFMDVDFDGEDELVINYRDMGKTGNKYTAYDIGDSALTKCIMPSVMDNYVTFDPAQKTVTYHPINGASDESRLVFRRTAEKQPITILEKNPFDYEPSSSEQLYADYKQLKESFWQLDTIHQTLYFPDEKREYLLVRKGNRLKILIK